MSIEVKQLVIKSTITDDEDEIHNEVNEDALVSMKQEILRECRRLFADMLIEKGRR